VSDDHSADGESQGVSGFQLQLLGNFVLCRDGAEILLPMCTQRLVAYLAIHGPSPRLVAIGTLWPDVGEPHARASLRTAIWRLHRCAPHLVRADGNILVLNPGARIDIRQLTAAAPVSLQDAGHVAGLPLSVDPRGELLPGWYEDWVIFERERLRQLRLHALDALAERLIAQARYAEALEAAIECARVEPLRETSNRLIIAIHLAEDNVFEAVRHYEFFRDLLRAELGIEPSPRTAGLLPAQRCKQVRLGAADSFAHRSPVGSRLTS
jgi:DNA-binding SARP family transcriptional activator